MQVQEELKNFLFENGVADVGFTCVDDCCSVHAKTAGAGRISWTRPTPAKG